MFSSPNCSGKVNNVSTIILSRSLGIYIRLLEARTNYKFILDFGVMTGKQHDALPCAFMFNSTGPYGSSNGTFSSPNFPGFYPRDTECHYFFYGDVNQRVRLHFHYFDVEGVLP